MLVKETREYFIVNIKFGQKHDDEAYRPAAIAGAVGIIASSKFPATHLKIQYLMIKSAGARSIEISCSDILVEYRDNKSPMITMTLYTLFSYQTVMISPFYNPIFYSFFYIFTLSDLTFNVGGVCFV